MLRGKLANQVDKHDLSSHCKMKACEMKQTTCWPQNRFTTEKKKIWPNKNSLLSLPSPVCNDLISLDGTRKQRSRDLMGHVH